MRVVENTLVLWGGERVPDVVLGSPCLFAKTSWGLAHEVEIKPPRLVGSPLWVAAVVLFQAPGRGPKCWAQWGGTLTS